MFPSGVKLGPLGIDVSRFVAGFVPRSVARQALPQGHSLRFRRQFLQDGVIDGEFFLGFSGTRVGVRHQQSHIGPLRSTWKTCKELTTAANDRFALASP